jgi:hypothetical protein
MTISLSSTAQADDDSALFITQQDKRWMPRLRRA